VRRALVLAAAALALAGCPIPQPLPDYPAGTVTPPRILVDQQLQEWDSAVTLVPANCTTIAPYQLSASVVDSNTLEGIEARWFVNYDFRNLAFSEVQWRDAISPNSDPNNLTRPVPAFLFDPYRYPPPLGTPSLAGPPYKQPGVLRVVELVVSNGFDPSNANTIAPGANRTPRPGFETQYHRWVFLTSSDVACP
jgi:hypothetical protein